MSATMDLSTDFILWTVLACIAAPHTLNLGHNARISTLQPFVIGAIVLFGLPKTLVLAAVSMAYFALVGRPRPRLHKSLFNLANLLASAAAAGSVFSLAGGRQGDVTSPRSLLALLLTVLAFFVVNTGFVALAVGLEKKMPPFRVWYEKYSWTVGAQLAGGSCVILVGALRQHAGAQVLYLTAPFCLLTYHFYRVCFRRSVRESHKT